MKSVARIPRKTDCCQLMLFPSFQVFLQRERQHGRSERKVDLERKEPSQLSVCCFASNITTNEPQSTYGFLSRLSVSHSEEESRPGSDLLARKMCCGGVAAINRSGLISPSIHLLLRWESSHSNGKPAATPVENDTSHQDLRFSLKRLPDRVNSSHCDGLCAQGYTLPIPRREIASLLLS